MTVPMTTRIVGDGGSRSVDELPAPTAPTAPTGPTAPTAPTPPTPPPPPPSAPPPNRMSSGAVLNARYGGGLRTNGKITRSVSTTKSSLKRSCGREGERQSTPMNANQRQSTPINGYQRQSIAINCHQL